MNVTKFSERILLSPPHMSGLEMNYIMEAFDSNYVVPLGPNVDNFEKQIINYLEDDTVHAVAMNSGTSAIHIALILEHIKPDEEVFCSSLTFVATANPILYEKAKPVFIDSTTEDWNLCPDTLLHAIKEKSKTGKIPRVLIVADLFGRSADYKRIEEICLEYNIALIEDSAESLGSKYNDKKCGSFGKYGIFSFNGNKIITTSGGGVLITHSKAQAEKALHLVTQARDKAPYYLHSQIGYNYRLSNISAGIGIGQLQVLEERVSSRRNVFKNYKNLLKNTPLLFELDNENVESNCWLSTARISEDSGKSPSQLINHLNNFNIESRHIWKPLHTQPLFQNCDFFSLTGKPVAENVFNSGICLPSASSMTYETQEKICKIIELFFY